MNRLMFAVVGGVLAAVSAISVMHIMSEAQWRSEMRTVVASLQRLEEKMSKAEHCRSMERQPGSTRSESAEMQPVRLGREIGSR